MKPNSLRLGEILEQRGRVTREQNLRALRNQKVLGGHLGTCLLEIDALREEELLAVLAELQGVPAVHPDELRNIPEEVIRKLPAKVAKRCLAVPFAAGSTHVSIAVTDARDLGVQDEINFVVGRRARFHVSSELRIVEALERYYGEESPTRYAKLVERMNRARYLWSRDELVGEAAIETQELLTPIRLAVESAEEPAAPAPPTRAAEPASGPPTSPGTAPPPKAEVAKSRKKPAEVSAPAPEKTPAATVPPAGPTDDDTQDLVPGASPEVRTLADAERRLLEPKHRDDVARTLLEFASYRTRRAVLFVVRKRDVAAWIWSGEGLDGPALAAFGVSLDAPSPFAAIDKGAEVFRGPLPPVPGLAPLVVAFAPPPSAELFLLPVRVRGRLVAALLAEPPGDGFAAGDLDDLKRLSAKAAIAFELCIMRSKLKKA